jgi:hypothetical protein
MDQLLEPQADPADDWLWHGYIARGNITLLTSEWKSGKTTLVAGLLRALRDGLPFLGRDCNRAAAVVVSEESPAHWVERSRGIPLGPHARLVSRPFVGRPTPAEWDELVRQAEALRAAGTLDLLVVDPLASFLPGRSESDPGTLLELLHPLRRLAEAGAAVLILHHPRKKPADEGSTARGSGALLGYVDVVLELKRFGMLKTDVNRRRLIGLSRRAETPPALVYEWVVGTPEFRRVDDPSAARFRENWDALKAVLESRKKAATHRELLTDWPPDRVPPSSTQLYEWLARATADGLIERKGSGTSRDPYRFGLPREEVEEFRLPPLEKLW